MFENTNIMSKNVTFAFLMAVSICLTRLDNFLARDTGFLGMDGSFSAQDKFIKKLAVQKYEMEKASC